MRVFETGATRDADTTKLDYEGFISPLFLRRFAEYMHMHRVQADGSLRSSDNWQKGIPLDAYMKSMFRHFMEVWIAFRKGRIDQEALCGLYFNTQGMYHESQRLAREASNQTSIAARVPETEQSDRRFSYPGLPLSTR